jgi:hypothetical protein
MCLTPVSVPMVMDEAGIGSVTKARSHPASQRFVNDSPLEGTGFELPVPPM